MGRWRIKMNYASSQLLYNNLYIVGYIKRRWLQWLGHVVRQIGEEDIEGTPGGR